MKTLGSFDVWKGSRTDREYWSGRESKGDMMFMTVEWREETVDRTI